MSAEPYVSLTSFEPYASLMSAEPHVSWSGAHVLHSTSQDLHTAGFSQALGTMCCVKGSGYGLRLPSFERVGKMGVLLGLLVSCLGGSPSVINSFVIQ
jgi:hypothetical protein